MAVKSYIQFKLFGEWTKTRMRVKGLPTALQASAMWGQRKAAQRLLKIVKGHITRQDLGWRALRNPGASHDSRILVDHGVYLSSITLWQKNFTILVGVRRGIVGRNGVEVARYANWHEYGTRKMPARPLWGPSLREMGGKDGMNAIVLSAIEKKLELLGWNPTRE